MDVEFLSGTTCNKNAHIICNSFENQIFDLVLEAVNSIYSSAISTWGTTRNHPSVDDNRSPTTF